MKTTQIGAFYIGNIIIPIVQVEPCYKLSQYFKGEEINCKCSDCIKRNESHEVIKARMDKIYNVQ